MFDHSTRSTRRAACAFATLVLFACSDRAPVGAHDQGLDRTPPATDGPRDGPAPRDRGSTDTVAADEAVPTADLPSPALDAGLCGVVCKPGEVYLISACVATDKLFTCAPGCDPKAPPSCGPGSVCQGFGGTPCCICSAAVPACVAQPNTGPIVGPLRINPTKGTAGQKVKITVTGAPFYVGALYYEVRMGSETKPEESAGGTCAIAATFTPPAPGAYAVEVSQYGGGPPWVLAGFYVASGGAVGPPTIQPGQFCKANPAPGDPACASAKPYSCTCVSGRCRCK